MARIRLGSVPLTQLFIHGIAEKYLEYVKGFIHCSR